MRLREYQKRRDEIFKANKLVVAPSRSSRRMREFWIRKRSLSRFVVSSITNKENDIRPFTQIEFWGQHYLALLDSGANKSVIGGNLAQRVLKDNLVSRRMCGVVRTADGQIQSVAGSIIMPLTYNSIKGEFEFLVVSSIKQDVICGMDFWKTFGISIIPSSSINEISNEEDSLKLELSASQKSKLQSVIEFFPSFEKDGLGMTSLIEHNIDTANAKPIKQRYYPLSPAKEKLLCGEIDRMLSMDVIEEAPSSPWSSPVTLHIKPGKVRFCLDARRLNDVTVRDAYPIPIMDGLLSRLPPVYCISKIDLKDAFWQICLDQESRAKTAFTVPNRPLYQFKRMPFGLSNAPQTMSRLMDLVIPYRLKSQVLVYLDDLLVLSHSFEDHLIHLSEVATQLRKAGLTINVQKSQFCLKKVDYLGYLVGEGTLQVNPDKIRAVDEFPIPKTQKQLRRFLGMTGWYQRFISNYSSVIFSLTELLRGKSFEWNEQAQAAFENVKSKLCSAPFLIHPDYEKPFIVQCDASFHGVGAVLAQCDDSGIERPIAYMSKKLNKAQRNYTVTELECLAVVLAIKKFRMYIDGHPFKVVTDHASLRWLMKQSDLSGRLARWAIKLQGFSFEIEHRKGSENVVADALSRSFEGVDEVAVIDCEVLPEIDLSSNAFQSAEYSALREKFVLSKLPDFQVIDDYIYHRTSFPDSAQANDCWKLLVPEALRQSVISSAHDQPSSAHCGTAKCLDQIRRRFYWPSMVIDVRDYVSKCEVCRTTKYPTHSLKPPMGARVVSERPFQRLYLDFIGPFPRTKKGNVGIFIILDHFSKFTFLKAVKRFTSKVAIEILREEIFSCFGVPETIVSDNGTQFKSHDFSDFLSKYGIQHFCTGAYAPQSNAAERVNRSINAALRAYVRTDQREWDVFLSSINSALRKSIHQSIGMSPYFVVFGQHMLSHGQDFKLLRNLSLLREGEVNLSRADEFPRIRSTLEKHLTKAYETNQRTYNLRTRPRSFEVGDEVIKRNFCLSNAATNFNAKLAPVGTKARIKKKLGQSIYLLEDLNGRELGKFHAKDIW